MNRQQCLGCVAVREEGEAVEEVDGLSDSESDEEVSMDSHSSSEDDVCESNNTDIVPLSWNEWDEISFFWNPALIPLEKTPLATPLVCAI